MSAVEIITKVVNWVASYSVLLLALGYLCVKLFVRHLISRLVKHNNDFWAALSWFTVDISLLSITVSGAINLPGKMGFGVTESVVWYFFLAIFLTATGFCYMFFLRQRVEKGGIGPFQDRRMFLTMTAGWAMAGVSFFLTFMSLPKP